MEHNKCKRCGDVTACVETEEEDGTFCPRCLFAEADYWAAQAQRLFPTVTS